MHQNMQIVELYNRWQGAVQQRIALKTTLEKLISGAWAWISEDIENGRLPLLTGLTFEEWPAARKRFAAYVEVAKRVEEEARVAYVAALDHEVQVQGIVGP